MDAGSYAVTRAAVEMFGYGHEIEWAQTVQAPKTPELLWAEYGWVVVNSGMRNQVAVGIWAKIGEARGRGEPACNVFGHAGKASSIDSFWAMREERFRAFTDTAARGTTEDLIEWCAALPWIGPITKWHLAKNLGVDCAKPDRWLERVAAGTGETVAELCDRLSAETGDRVATVDLVIWRACNLGLLTP